MERNERDLRLRVMRHERPDLGKLIEWVLNIAETRHQAWLRGDPDPYCLPPPEGLALANDTDRSESFVLSQVREKIEDR